MAHDQIDKPRPGQQKYLVGVFFVVRTHQIKQPTFVLHKPREQVLLSPTHLCAAQAERTGPLVRAAPQSRGCVGSNGG